MGVLVEPADPLGGARRACATSTGCRPRSIRRPTRSAATSASSARSRCRKTEDAARPPLLDPALPAHDRRAAGPRRRGRARVGRPRDSGGVAMSDWRVTLTEIELPGVRRRGGARHAALGLADDGAPHAGPRGRRFASQSAPSTRVAVSSGTAALHLACLAAGVGPGRRGHRAGAQLRRRRPRRPLRGRRDGARRLRLAGRAADRPGGRRAPHHRRTKAVIAVHMFGYPADIEALRAICDERGIALIEDCAEADGGRLRDGSPAGTAGRLRLLLVLLEDAARGGRGRDPGHRRRRVRRARALAALARDDLGHLGPPPRPRRDLRRHRPRLQLPDRRAARHPGAGAAGAPGRGAVGAAPGRRPPTASASPSVDGVEVPFPDEWVELCGPLRLPGARRRPRDARRRPRDDARRSGSRPPSTRRSPSSRLRAVDARRERPSPRTSPTATWRCRCRPARRRARSTRLSRHSRRPCFNSRPPCRR